MSKKSSPPTEDEPEKLVHPLERILLKIQIWQAKFRIEKLKRERERKGNGGR